MVARHRDVIEEDVGVGTAADRHAITLQREALADSAPAGAHDQRGAAALSDDLIELDGHELARLVDPVGRRGRLGAAGPMAGGRLGVADEGATALAVVGPVGVAEPALRAMTGHDDALLSSYSPAGSSPAARPARMSVRRCTSAPVMTSSPPSCRLRSRFTSSARRMSIFPCRMRRR